MNRWDRNNEFHSHRAWMVSIVTEATGWCGWKNGIVADRSAAPLTRVLPPFFGGPFAFGRGVRTGGFGLFHQSLRLFGLLPGNHHFEAEGRQPKGANHQRRNAV